MATVSDSIATATGAGDTYIAATWTDYFRVAGNPCPPPTALAQAGEQCTADKEQPPGEKIKDGQTEELDLPGCGGCRSTVIHPQPTVIFSVRPKITITRNGNPITTAQNVIVGQQMRLSATVRGGTPSSHQWNVPGTRVANYEVTCVITNEYCNPTSAVVTPLTNLNNPTVEYYWVDGGDGRQVSYTVTIRGRQYSKIATFNVKRPVAQVVASTGSVQLTTFADGYGLWFGSTTTPGITFTRTVTMPNNFDGDLQWVQTWNKFRRLKIRGYWYRSSGVGLDSVYPYSTLSSANDSPGIAFESRWQEVQINDSHQMWLMFKPTGVTESTIWVPLRKVDWAWSGQTVQNNGVWQLLNSTHTNNPPDVDSTSHPVWVTNPATIDFSLEQP